MYFIHEFDSKKALGLLLEKPYLFQSLSLLLVCVAQHFDSRMKFNIVGFASRLFERFQCGSSSFFVHIWITFQFDQLRRRKRARNGANGESGETK